jgi:hypothetical protein
VSRTHWNDYIYQPELIDGDYVFASAVVVFVVVLTRRRLHAR